MARKPKNFMAGAVKHPGALRATAKAEGLIKGDESLTASDITKIKASKNPLTRKRATLAETFMRARRG